MKKAGRVGDSPLSGSGFYVDSEIGGAAATGLGEDLMKGCLSYEIVRLMGEGLSPQAACDRAVYGFEERLRKRYGKAGAFSLIALDKNGCLRREHAAGRLEPPLRGTCHDGLRAGFRQ